MSVSLRVLKSALRALVLGTLTVLGVGYAVVNVAVIVLLIYYLSLFTISSVQVVIEMSGIILFLLASATMMTVGVLLVVGGLRYYRGISPRGLMFLGTLLGSFYLLCLGTGSVLLLLPEMNMYVVLLIVGSIFVMVGTAVYVPRSFSSRFVGSILGIIGGLLLTLVALHLEVFKFVFVQWNVPFPGPFMSMKTLEAAALILGSIAVLVYSVLAEHRKGPVKYVFLPITTLVYGIGVFIGPLILAFSLWDHIWKAPWLPPLHGAPRWVISTTMLWSAGLFILAFGGILLIASSYMGFHLVVSARESSAVKE